MGARHRVSSRDLFSKVTHEKALTHEALIPPPSSTLGMSVESINVTRQVLLFGKPSLCILSGFVADLRVWMIFSVQFDLELLHFLMSVKRFSLQC